MKKLILIAAIAAVSPACSILTPDYGKIEPVDHISHLLKGEPFGPRTEEDTITQSNILAGWERPFGPRSYIEIGVGWMWKDRGFTGGPFTATARAGKKICFKPEKCE